MREACFTLPSSCLPHQVLLSIHHIDLKCCNILLLRGSLVFQDVEYHPPFLRANELPGTSILQEQIHSFHFHQVFLFPGTGSWKQSLSIKWGDLRAAVIHSFQQEIGLSSRAIWLLVSNLEF